MRYAVIMAGGSGKRLWPLSRARRPKQLLPLFGGKNLLNVAVERLDGLFDPDNIYIITNAEYAHAIRDALPQLPAANVVGEPVGRDTSNAIALAAQIIHGRDKDPTSTMAVFTADHIIRPQDEFAACVHKACQAAENHPEALLTFGIRPNWPHTGLGYIHCDELVGDGVYTVQGFREKPDRQTARQYVESGEYFWNSGMFVWTVKAIRNALMEFLADSMARLMPISQAVGEGEDIAPILSDVYPDLEKISIDYAVMEKAREVMMVELTCQWLDVGSWPALADVTDLDNQGNAIVADKTIVMDSSHNVIVSEDDHLLAVLGMEDTVIVHSPEATLVASKSESQRLKDMVGEIGETFGEDYI